MIQLLIEMLSALIFQTGVDLSLFSGCVATLLKKNNPQYSPNFYIVFSIYIFFFWKFKKNQYVNDFRYNVCWSDIVHFEYITLFKAIELVMLIMFWYTEIHS